MKIAGYRINFSYHVNAIGWLIITFWNCPAVNSLCVYGRCCNFYCLAETFLGGWLAQDEVKMSKVLARTPKEPEATGGQDDVCV